MPHEAKDPFDQAFDDMSRFVKSDDPVPEAKPNTPTPEPKPDETATPQETPPEDAAAQAAAEAENPLGDGKKVSPWKLVNHYKNQHAILQKEVAELRTRTAEPPKEHVEKMSQIEQRNAELEKEIAFVNYRKSREFIEGFQKPYEQAWSEALQSLNGLQLQWANTETGDVQRRDLTPQDIQALVTMEPGTARAEIKARFPDDHAEVKQHVDKIRAMTNAHNKQLEEHQTHGVEWMKQRKEQYHKAIQGIHESNKELWQQANQEHVDKFEFLRPVDGQDERNEKLTKATEFVDGAMAARANDPSLSPEDRAAAVRKHVALRNRAIGYSVLSYENKSLKSRIAELEKNLADYQASEPGIGEGKGHEGQMAGGDPIENAAMGLSKYAR